jgi:periplasmic divalent cation tolerance protein
MRQFLQIQTTLPSEAAARELAAELVGRKLAACVQIVGPVASTYAWKGNVETSAEWLCLLKSEAALFGPLQRLLESIHPYECPELIATPILHLNPAYAQWLDAELAAAPVEETG